MNKNKGSRAIESTPTESLMKAVEEISARLADHQIKLEVMEELLVKTNSVVHQLYQEEVERRRRQ